jgi:hypothetical protein
MTSDRDADHNAAAREIAAEPRNEISRLSPAGAAVPLHKQTG